MAAFVFMGLAQPLVIHNLVLYGRTLFFLELSGEATFRDLGFLEQMMVATLFPFSLTFPIPTPYMSHLANF